MPRSQRSPGLELFTSAKDRSAFERLGLACRPNLAGWSYAESIPYYLGIAAGLDR